MKELLRIKMFELKGSGYLMIGSDVSLERFIMEGLHDDFSLMDMRDFGAERIRVTLQYYPAAAQKVLESGNVLTGDKPIQDV